MQLPRNARRRDVDAAHVSLQWLRRPRNGRQSVRFAVRGSRLKGWVQVELAERTAVWVANRDLRAGQALVAEDLRIEMRGETRRHDYQFASPPIGRVLRCDVKRGTGVRRACAGPAPKLERGHPVTIIVKRGRITVRSAGRLKYPRRVGDQAVVETLGTGARLVGTLTDGRTVVVR